MSRPGETRRPSPEHSKLLICVWHPFSEWRPKPMLARAIRQRWPQLDLVELPDYRGLAEQLPDTHIFVGASLRPEQFAHARNLQWIHSTAAGVWQLMYPELRSSGVIVTNPSGIFSVPMAEHTVGLLLALARNFPDAVRYQDGAKWSAQDLWDKPQQLTEINGKLLLIVGYGSIGRELARRAAAFGLRVFRPGRRDPRGENPARFTTRRSAAARGLCGPLRPGDFRDETSDGPRTASRDEARRAADQCGARLLAR
jgi:phosphoglycerate dehydrogenase-like enzyme